MIYWNVCSDSPSRVLPATHTAREGMADRAVATARATGDGRVLAAALLGKHNVLWGPDTPEERLAVLAELERLATDDEELAAEAQLLRATALLELGDARGTAQLASFTRRAGRSPLARVRWMGRSREAMLAVLAGDLPLADRLATEVRRFATSSASRTPGTWRRDCGPGSTASAAGPPRTWWTRSTAWSAGSPSR